MASFDFIEAGVKGYEFVWRERKYLARVAFPVIFVKVACLLAVITFGAQKQYLLYGIITFPGFVVEALFIIGAMRYLLYSEPIFIWGRTPYPSQPTNPIFPPVSSKNRLLCLQAGIAMYMLIKLTEILLNSYSRTINDALNDPNFSQAGPPEPTLVSALLVLALMGAFVWGFRLFFLYVPLTMNITIKKYMNKLSGLESSIYMIGTYLICYLPILVVFIFLSELFKTIFLSLPGIPTIIDAIFISLHEVVTALVVATAMTYGIIEILFGSDKQKEK